MDNKAEERYIRKRKIKAFGNKLCFYMCRIFPVKKNLISVCTFEGKGGFGCNPKYIVQELHKRNPKYEFVWFVNDMNKEFPDYIKKVPNTLWSRAYWLSRSKVWIDNYRKPYGTVKRKGQYYINTWHGASGFKSIGLWREEAFSKIAYLVSKNDSDMIDYIPIDSEWCAEVFPKGLVYSGKFLWTGSPRCDILYGEAKNYYRKKFIDKYNLLPETKIVMFAPTFREGSINGKRTVFSENWSLDFDRLIRNLKKRFGGEWIICLRVHPQLADMVSEYNSNESTVIDVSKEDDMYEILTAVDVLITDYSCVAMDACISYIPVLIYADDIEKYVHNRGSLLWNMSTDSSVDVFNNKKMTPGINVELPFLIAQNNDEMEYNISVFDKNIYQKKVNDFSTAIKLIHDGKASCRVADQIEDCFLK